ncbi:Transposon Ty3-G Gag-Pol polyprotein [Gossypium australe]|uniref:Transposon Ty3-G Gag-Pol polyprotein n=1 Tax=Gossypium australe TaxID=47621 RepID=A0A5B6VKU7_9ROSI|nr:Transposon Ty3-G Gag-Pol polyprotein [Gossypium australe]
MTHIFKQHGLPESIISNRDKVFINHFWQNLFMRGGTKLHLSTTYHSETNGQTEVNVLVSGYNGSPWQSGGIILLTILP